MDKDMKKNIILIGVAAVALAFVMHWNQVLDAAGHFIGLMFPVLIGIMIAFVMNVPIRGVERFLTKLQNKHKFRMSSKTKCGIGLFVTLIGACLVIALTINILVPNLIETINSLIELTNKHIPAFLSQIEEYGINTDKIYGYIKQLDIQTVIAKITESSGNIAGMVSDTIAKVVSALIGFIIAIYIILDKGKFGPQLAKVLHAYLPKKTADRVIEIGRLIDSTYSKFLTGQCIEAVIIGVLMFLGLTIFRIPYASVIAILASILSFIPYIGPFFACFAGMLFIVVINPWTALLEFVVYQVIQMVEGQFIYPKVVGNSVGLPALFTLLAALLGGKFFGLVGMIFFIPLTAVMYTLLRDNVNHRTERKAVRQTDEKRTKEY